MYRIAFLFLVSMVLARLDTIQAQSFEPATWILEAGDVVKNFGLDVDASGSVYMSGRVPSGYEIHWSDGTVFVPEPNATFLARVTADGSVRWVRPGTRFGESNHSAIHTVVAQGPNVWTNEGAPRGGSFMPSRWGGYGGILVNRYSENGDSLQATYLAGPVDNIFDVFDAPGYILGLGGDDAGNMYAAGHYIDTLRLSPAHVLVPREQGLNQYVFLAAYSPEDSVRWVHGMAGRSEGITFNSKDRINGFKEPAKPTFDVDSHGNTYLGGFFRKGTVFAAGQPDSVRLEESGAIVVSYDVAGQLRWLWTGSDLGVEADWLSHTPDRYLRPDNMAVPWSLAVSDDGELALQWRVRYGNYGIYVTVGDTAFWEGSGSSGVFHLITRHAPDGSLRWVRRLPANGFVEPAEVAMDRQGHVYVGGSYWGHQVQIEDIVLTNGTAPGSITYTGLLVHYDAEGNVARTLQVTGPRHTMVSSIVPMPGGELYVAGFAYGDRDGPDQIILGVDTLAIRPGRSKAFLAKYGPLTTARESNHERPVNRLQIAHYPNPFAGAATIAYELPNTSHVVLRVYDILGRELAVLVDERQGAGLHSAQLDASALPNGVYLYRLEAGNQVATGRLVRRK